MRTSRFPAIVLVLSVSATASADSRWLPWLGCWDLIYESVDYENVGTASDGLLCLSPGVDDIGVKISTIVGGNVVLEETLLADGVRRPVAESGCRGWQVNEWSRDGHRLFVRSEMSCEGDMERSFSGVSLMVPGRIWVDIQVVGVEDQREVVIRRYRRASAEAIREAGVESLSQEESLAASTARLAVARRLTIDDVIEVAGKIDSEAVEAVLMEADASFELGGESLIRLADSDVPAEVIDLMVALAYPDYFKIGREGVEAGQGPAYAPVYGGMGPYSYDYWYYDYSPFGYPYRYGSYYGYGGYGGYYGRTGVRSRGISGGRVVKGRGYTRVEREGGSDSVFGRGLDFLRRGGESSSGSSGSSESSAGKGGYSKSGSSSGRTAKPKKK